VTTGAHFTDHASRGGFAIPIDRAKPMLRAAQSTAAAAQIRPPALPAR
jgi:hypothetical protein